MTRIRSTTGLAELDGLIEGPLPPFPDGDDRLREWTAFASANGLVFDLRIEGRSFSLLASTKPFHVPRHESLVDKLRQSLDQLLRLYPDDLRSRVCSTVRSTEHLDGEKLQAIYVNGPSGMETREQRTALPPEPPPTPTERRQLSFSWIVTSLVALAALGVFAYTFDFRGFLRLLRSTIAGIDVAQIEIDDAAFARYVTFRKLGVDRSGAHLEIEATRTKDFPRDLAAFIAEEARIEAAKDLGQKLAFTHLMVMGQVRAVGLDKDGAVAFTCECLVRSLGNNESTKIRVPLSDHPDVVKLRLEY